MCREGETTQGTGQKAIQIVSVGSVLEGKLTLIESFVSPTFENFNKHEVDKSTFQESSTVLTSDNFIPAVSWIGERDGTHAAVEACNIGETEAGLSKDTSGKVS